VDKASAYRTLHECLVTASAMLAPFTPFVTEELWSNLAAGRDGAPSSVHLADYPEPDLAAVDPALDQAMRAARAIVSLGRTARTDTKTKVRQPLSRAVVHYAGDHAALEPVLDLVGEELNVKAVEFAESAEQLAGWRARPNFRVLGPRLGPAVKDVARALAGDDGSIAAALARGESVQVEAAGREVALSPSDVELSQEVREGWGVAAEGGITVALDLTITPELRREGLARDVVRVVQDARKAAGLDVSDRIELGLEATGELKEAIEAHGDHIGSETLAVSLAGTVADPDSDTMAEIDGGSLRVTLRRTRAN